MTTTCNFTKPVTYPGINAPTLPTDHWNFASSTCYTETNIIATTTGLTGGDILTNFFLFSIFLVLIFGIFIFKFLGIKIHKSQ